MKLSGTQWPKRLRDDGYSALISKWDHWITVAPDKDGGTRYSDEVEVSAGALTPFIWAFAQIFYWHRQRRWRGLAKSLAARRVIAAEMAAYRAASLRASMSLPGIIWSGHILYRSPILGRISPVMTMLRFAVELRDWQRSCWADLSGSLSRRSVR